jgi:hypothetical protein
MFKSNQTLKARPINFIKENEHNPPTSIFKNVFTSQ